MVDQATIDALVQPFEDLRVDGGFCRWTDVASAMGQLRRALAAKDSPSSQMVGSDIAALEKQIKDLKHILASAEGRAKAATSNLDYWRGQYEAIAAKGDAWLAELEMAILCSDDHDQNKVLENYRKVLRAVKDKRAADELAVTSISPLLNPPPAPRGGDNN